MSNKDILHLILNKLDNVDKRLDNVDKRLDNVDKRLDNVDKRLDNIEKKFDKKINNIELKLNELIQYRIINDKIIEKQLTKDVQNYLIDTYKCCVVINISDKIPKKLFNSNGKILTEFDGVFIVSNDISLLSKFDKSFKNKENNIKEKDIINKFIIVEAKHYVKKQKLIDNVNKLDSIKESIKTFNEINKNSKNKNIIKFIKNFNECYLNYFNEDDIFLIIGGPYFDDDALNYYNKNLKKNKFITKFDLSKNTNFNNSFHLYL